MSKKRGANSPNVSEKSKAKPSAAAATLSMASMLSVMSGAFSTQGASSQVTDSEDDYQSQVEDGTDVQPPNQASNNVWNEENLQNSRVRSPRKQDDRIEPLFNHRSDGAMRDEIEIEVQSKNDKKFTGTITQTEAKHLIYIGALKFNNHDNFDGVRISFRGKLYVTFKLIEPIDIDELEPVEFFEFTRTSSIRGKRVEETIGCKIRGIRQRPQAVSAFDNFSADDQKVVKIEGCDYRIPENEILAWLNLYGEVTSKLEEDCFRDATNATTTGNNRTGNYSVTMKLQSNIPQLLPMSGRRIKMYHSGIVKLCTQCFGPHKKQVCPSKEKIPWTTYVRHFIEDNPEIPKDYYGKWNEIIEKVASETRGQRHHQAREPDTEKIVEKAQANEGQILVEPENRQQDSQETTDARRETTELKEPTEEDFDLPTSEEAYERMVERFASIGLARWEADLAIKNKRTAFSRACREFKKQKMNEDSKQTKRQGRKNSITKI
jgi:hypothetical protein